MRTVLGWFVPVVLLSVGGAAALDAIGQAEAELASEQHNLYNYQQQMGLESINRRHLVVLQQLVEARATIVGALKANNDDACRSALQHVDKLKERLALLDQWAGFQTQMVGLKPVDPAADAQELACAQRIRSLLQETVDLCANTIQQDEAGVALPTTLQAHLAKSANVLQALRDELSALQAFNTADCARKEAAPDLRGLSDWQKESLNVRLSINAALVVVSKERVTATETGDTNALAALETRRAKFCDELAGLDAETAARAARHDADEILAKTPESCKPLYQEILKLRNDAAALTTPTRHERGGPVEVARRATAAATMNARADALGALLEVRMERSAVLETGTDLKDNPLVKALLDKCGKDLLELEGLVRARAELAGAATELQGRAELRGIAIQDVKSALALDFGALEQSLSRVLTHPEGEVLNVTALAPQLSATANKELAALDNELPVAKELAADEWASLRKLLLDADTRAREAGRLADTFKLGEARAAYLNAQDALELFYSVQPILVQRNQLEAQFKAVEKLPASPAAKQALAQFRKQSSNAIALRCAASELQHKNDATKLLAALDEALTMQAEAQKSGASLARLLDDDAAIAAQRAAPPPSSKNDDNF